MENRILESDLRLPALFLIQLRNGNITTSELSDSLRNILNLSASDLEILNNRKDDYFSQIVRNLTGTVRPFVQNGFINRTSNRNSPLTIGEKGINYLNENNEILQYLLLNNFKFHDLTKSLRRIEDNQKKKIEIFDENILINEGVKSIKEVAVYERSTKLRNYAIKHFSKNDKISCNCCSFNFEDFYGDSIGKSFIEIHHTKPIFKYEDEDIESTLSQAVENLTPVCSNCHRMIHRKWNKPIEIQMLIENINLHGIFHRHVNFTT